MRGELGDLVFGTDGDTMESVVLDLLPPARASPWRPPSRSPAASSAPGSTGIPGASDVFRGAIVSYATEVKQPVLGVAEGPVVSEAAARQMAHGVREVLGADVGLSLTGVAGPDEQDGQPVGTLCVGMVGPGFERSATSDSPANASRCASSA